MCSLIPGTSSFQAQYTPGEQPPSLCPLFPYRNANGMGAAPLSKQQSQHFNHSIGRPVKKKLVWLIPNCHHLEKEDNFFFYSDSPCCDDVN